MHQHDGEIPRLFCFFERDRKYFFHVWSLALLYPKESYREHLALRESRPLGVLYNAMAAMLMISNLLCRG